MDKTIPVLNPYDGFPVWVILTIAGLLLVLSVLSYRRTTRPISPRLRKLLILLRICAILLVSLCLLRPSLELTKRTPVKRPLIFLRDRSRSMTFLKDTDSGDSRWREVEKAFHKNAGLLEDIDEQYVRVITDFAMGLLGDSADARRGRTGLSAYGTSMRDAVRLAPQGQIEALVIFGDGSNNSGRVDPREMARLLGQRRVPVYTVGIGRETPTEQLRDVRITELTAPKTAFRFTNVPVRARLTARGCRGGEVTVRLTGRKLGELPGTEPVVKLEKTVSVAHNEETVPVEFEVKLDEMGEYEFLALAEPFPDELLDDNNSAKAWVKVSDSGVRVAYFDLLRPESKFIARALTGMENLGLERTLVLVGRDVPSDRQSEIALNDVTILGDVPPSAFQPTRILELVDAMQKKGRGVIVLLTEGNGGVRGWQAGTLGDVLPVRVPAPAHAAPGPHDFVVEAFHADHPAVAMADETAATLKAWSEAPPLDGVILGVEPKPGAQVLARDKDGQPLLVVHRSGKGRIACLMADTTFNWTFTQSETQTLFLRFWRQLVMWASGREPEVALRVKLDRQHPVIGDALKITAVLTDRGGAPMRDARVSLKIRKPDGTTQDVACAYSSAEAAYAVEFFPPVDGDYTIEARARRNDDDLAEDTTHFSAGSQDKELENPMADHSLLRAVAKETSSFGGAYYDCDSAGELFRMLRDRAKPVMLSRKQRWDVWDTRLMFFVLGTCIVAEWCLRKWKGLV